MGKTSWRVRTRPQVLSSLARGVAAGAAITLTAPIMGIAPAQAGLLDGVKDTVAETTGSIPIVSDVVDTKIDDGVIETILEEGEQVVDGVVTDPSGVTTKIVDPNTGVVADPAGKLIGILDPSTGSLLLPPLPGIDSGAGQLLALLDDGLTEVCSSADAACDALPLDQMVDEAAVVLKAVPTNPGDIPAWDPATCPAIIADICLISVDDLAGDTPLAPIVSFLPGGSGDPDAPDTTITSQPPGKQARTHTFRFTAQPSTPTTRFECKLEVAFKSTPPSGAPRSHDWQACADPKGSQPYANLANGTYVFAVQAVDGPEDDPSADETPATQSWTVALPPEVPDTRIVSGPKGNAWVLTNRVTFTFDSTVRPAEYQCRYDNLTNACDSGRFTWTNRMKKLTPGRHVFTVAAYANRTQDFTPARRAFNVPLDDRALAGTPWTRARQKGHFKGTYTTTTVKGASLATRTPQKFRRVVLVADKGRGFGTVRVFLGKKMLKEVSLQAKRAQVRRVIPVKRFTGKLRQGKLRIVVVSAGKTVRIDGLGLARR